MDNESKQKAIGWFGDISNIAALLAIAMFSMAGVPPTVGFYAKLSVLQAVVKADFIWLAILAVFLLPTFIHLTRALRHGCCPRGCQAQLLLHLWHCRLLPLPRLDLVLLHLQRPLDPVQLEVKPAGVADGLAGGVAAPQGGDVGLAVGAAGARTETGATVL